MKENDVVLKTVTKIVVFILLTFGFYVFFAGHNNPGGGFIGGLIFSSAFILMFLAFDVKEVLISLPIDFKKLMNKFYVFRIFYGCVQRTERVDGEESPFFAHSFQS